MPYNNNNHLITAPIGIGDISQALNNSSTDLGTLCNSNNIKKWAKYKPEHWQVDTNPPVGYLTDSQRKNNHYGLEWFKYKAPNGNSVPIADLKTLMLGTLCNGLYTYKDRGFVENGGAATTTKEPKRIADFLAFSGSTPYTQDRGYYTQATGPISSGTIIQGTSDGTGGNSSVSLSWAVSNINNIGLGDLVNIGSDALYYGVLFLGYDENFIGSYTSAYDILNESTTDNIIYEDFVTLVWHKEQGSTIPTYTSCSQIDAKDIYDAGLTPTPYVPEGQAGYTKNYYYIIVPVLFRGGKINNLSAGFCRFALNKTFSQDINNFDFIPLPVAPSQFTPTGSGSMAFMAHFGAIGATTPDLAVIIASFEGNRNTETSPYVTLESVKIILRGADDMGSAYNRKVKIDFYVATEPKEPGDYTIVKTLEHTLSDNTEEEAISLENWTYVFANLRCRAYLKDYSEKYNDVLITDYMSFNE